MVGEFFESEAATKESALSIAGEGDMHELSESKTNPRNVSLLVGVKTDLSECINSKTKTLEDINSFIL